jgi:hypothetical protein
MNKTDSYILDTDALIDYYNHFPKKFKRLKELAKSGILKIPEGVFRELKRKSDKLKRYVEKWENDYNIVITIKSDFRLVNDFGRIDTTYGEEVKVGGRVYPGFWKSPSGRKAADGQLVTIGKVQKYIVVSDDKAVRLACLLEDVECIGWSEFARRIGIIDNPNQQGSLFDEPE